MNKNLMKRAFKRRVNEMQEGTWNMDFSELIDNVRKWDGYDVINAPQHVRNEFLSEAIKAYNINTALLSECSFEASKNIGMGYLSEKEMI